MTRERFTSLELCSGLGGQALGLEQAGFDPVMLVDADEGSCKTIALNRRHWAVLREDVRSIDPHDLFDSVPQGVDLISAGLPRIKSSAQVARRNDDQEREVLRAVVRLTTSLCPRALLLENLDALVVGDKFAGDREWIERELTGHGYRAHWNVLDAADFGVPQCRRSGFLVALPAAASRSFRWPSGGDTRPSTVGEVLYSSMAGRGWPGARRWSEAADRPGPALIGGSNRRGGADLGPSGSKKAWLGVGVDGSSLSDDVPHAKFPVDGVPKITIRQAAMLQRIPDHWVIYGGKTAVYRQIGHAMPPPVAKAMGIALADVLAG